MDLIADYSESEESSKNETSTNVNIAPPTAKLNSSTSSLPFPGFNTRSVNFNPEYETLYTPVQGPTHPLYGNIAVPIEINSYNGNIERLAVRGALFDKQYHQMSQIGSVDSPAGVVHATHHVNQPFAAKRKRESFGDAGENSFKGPWAPFEEDTRLSEELAKNAEIYKQLQAEREANGELDKRGRYKKKHVETPKQKEKEEKKETDKETEKDEEQAPTVEGPPKKQKQQSENVTTSTTQTASEDQEGEGESESTRVNRTLTTKSQFHGTVFRDYQGRTFVDHPSDLKPHAHECFYPKKLLHTYKGHTKGVSAIRLFPKYGHVLLSAGMDSQVKIWDVYNKRTCLRTYEGHTKAVRDICFSNDGRRFLSASYDRNILLWDTETGQCLGSFSNGKIPICVKFNPEPSKQNQFIVGCQDKRVIQWDTNSGKVSQIYDQHLGAVNTLTFIDNAKRFVSTADDKTVRLWEWGIPVVIKYISEPSMHSMPAVELTYNQSYMLCQSLDNQILTYNVRDRFRMAKKKVFKGHLNGGYACQPGSSPDGHWVCSGDAEGNLHIWDWDTCKLMKTYKAHDNVTIGSIWHPIEPSQVFTCSWDGTVKLWD